MPAHHRQLDFESSALRPLRYLSASRFCLVHEASPAGKPFFRGYAEALSSGLPPALQREYTTLLHIGMEQAGVTDVRRALMLGDSLSSDIAAAANAGVDACWYNPKGAENKKGLPVRYEIRDLDEVDAILLGEEENA